MVVDSRVDHDGHLAHAHAWPSPSCMHAMRHRVLHHSAELEVGVTHHAIVTFQPRRSGECGRGVSIIRRVA